MSDEKLTPEEQQMKRMAHIAIQEMKDEAMRAVGSSLLSKIWWMAVAALVTWFATSHVPKG